MPGRSDDFTTVKSVTVIGKSIPGPCMSLQSALQIKIHMEESKMSKERAAALEAAAADDSRVPCSSLSTVQTRVHIKHMA